MTTMTPPLETHRTKGEQLLARIRELIREGNVRRIIVKNDEGRTLVEVPLTIGVVGALLLPAWAALGAVAALVSDCSIEVEREVDDSPGIADEATAEPVAHEARAAVFLDAHEDELHVDREC